MRISSSTLLLPFLLTLPSAANAGLGAEVSIGKGAQTSPSSHAEQLNLMLAPGFTLATVFRLQLGIVNELPDTANSRYNLELRPMVTLADPTFPLYGRVIFGITNILHGDSTVAFGAAGGVKVRLGQASGLFGEIGLLPRSRNDQLSWILEGRLGVYVGF